MSILISSISASIKDSRSDLNFFLISFNSSFMTFNNASWLSRIWRNCLINASSSLCSPSSATMSVKRYNCNITIASACSSVNSYTSIRFSLASRLFLELRINSITLSKIDNALIKPSTICIRFSALSNSNFVLFATTSIWWFK